MLSIHVGTTSVILSANNKIFQGHLIPGPGSFDITQLVQGMA